MNTNTFVPVYCHEQPHHRTRRAKVEMREREQAARRGNTHASQDRNGTTSYGLKLS